MLSFGALSFLMPWALAGLLSLPVIWWLVRLTPPHPRNVNFPAIALLARLRAAQPEAYSMPWWLLLIRLLLVVLLIIGAARPVFNTQDFIRANGPLVLVMDDGWASAPHWNEMVNTARNHITQADRQNRQVVLALSAPKRGMPIVEVLSPGAALEKLNALEPRPWRVDRKQLVDALNLSSAGRVVWLSNGLAGVHDSALVDVLQRLGPLRVIEPATGTRAISVMPPLRDGGDLLIPVYRAGNRGSMATTLIAYDEDGHAVDRVVAWFKDGEQAAEVRVSLPVEVRNRLMRIESETLKSAGSVVLLDERWRRRPVGIVTGGRAQGVQRLLSDYYYLQRAIEPQGDIRQGSIAGLLEREITVMVLVDPSFLSPDELAQLTRWVNAGGLLVVFAGPRLAETAGNAGAGHGIADLLPVKLRGGNRVLGGAMSWRRPARVAPFPQKSPYHGLVVPADVTVKRQVLAQPDFELEDKIWAQLDDGTPLVSGAVLGQGLSVLFHVSANAEWSSLPMSGLFVEMLQRTIELAQGVRGIHGTGLLKPQETLDGFGHLGTAPRSALSFTGDGFAAGAVSPDHPPGFYGNEYARQALNLSAGMEPPQRIAGLPQSVAREVYQASRELDLTAWLFSAALLLFAGDLLASLWLRGVRFVRWGGALMSVFLIPAVAQAQDSASLVQAVNMQRLAYVVSGQPEVDEASLMGLAGLGAIMRQRTAVELDAPVGIDLEIDELVFYPLIYWPVNADTAVPSIRAARRINTYLANGGTVLFDTAGRRGSGGIAILRRFATVLDIPQLVPVAGDHVLTRAYYLLSDFPGRWTGGKVWVVPAGERINDGVSPVIAGSNGWAGAWAVDNNAEPLYVVIPGGERQREMAYRFGVNLVMYVLTGNYKSDQVHLQSIMDRLGQ